MQTYGQTILGQSLLPSILAAKPKLPLTFAQKTNNYTNAVYNLIESLRSSIFAPNDQIRILIPLCSYRTDLQPFNPNTPDSDPLPQLPYVSPILALACAVASLARRMALASLAQACISYTPTSREDAQKLLLNILPLYDAEILYCGNFGDMATYGVLRQLRSDVAIDLNTRGGNLPDLVVYKFKKPLPSLYLAYRLYQDATRSDELVARVDPANPLFMPMSFEALSF